MNGFMGKLLVVDLTNGQISTLPLDEGYARQFVGGAGLACRYLYERVDRRTDPLGPENPLMFMTGPLVGTEAPLCGRYVVCARSPLTGLWGESNSGGRFGPYLRFAGYDGILVTGKAPYPVYLSIWNGQAELKDARSLWGKDTYETQVAIRDELQRAQLSIACIGPAGENLVKYAAVMNDWGRAAGRTGMGAVMGSKNLKAIAVGGDFRVPLADEARFKAAAQAASEEIKADVKAQFLAAGGTASTIDTTMWIGDVPSKYFTEALWEPVAHLSGATMAETILVGKRACYRCVIGCGRVTSVTGKYAKEKIDGPEYETVVALGSLILSDDLPAVAYANHLCNAYGLDTISAGVTIAFAYYLYDRGILTTSDTNGLELKWGDIEAALTLLEQIAQRKGFGAVLAEGSRYLGRKYGVEDWAVQVNGLEVPMHEPRAFTGMALVYATSPRGACHTQGDMFLVDLGAPVPELDIQIGNRLESSEEKALMTARVMNWRTLYGSLVMCVFGNPQASNILAMLNGVTGWDLQLEDLLLLGERAFNLKRLFNGKLGLTAENDRLPKLLLQPLPSDVVETQVPDMGVLLPAYYRVRGWDSQTGMPTHAKLQELGLEDLAFS
ncbi:MAG: aldehyde ferredoxin oxidoreductase family protein [Chloroflexi bacterium]|nr:aldehyde ferredoxin oxidoreductase family protein [Chloroflexota bacterium]